MNRLFASLFAGLPLVALSVCGADSEFKFTFDSSATRPGFKVVAPDLAFTTERGFGFDLASKTELAGGGVTASRPFFFSVVVPEGNHDVSITFGDAKSATTNTVKAEMRRLMLERVVTKPGEFVTRTITVNTRTPEISGELGVHPPDSLSPSEGERAGVRGGSVVGASQLPAASASSHPSVPLPEPRSSRHKEAHFEMNRWSLLTSAATVQGFKARNLLSGNSLPVEGRGKLDRVRLKQREKDSEMINWDEKLTLEFNGSRPGVAALEIAPAKVPTVFLLGDSTVCDQPLEPWNSWGQMLPRFFKSGLAIANHAQSGESIKSSLGAKRFDKVFSEMKQGDWLLLQFGHNDMKDKATNALETYRANLKKIAERTREKGGTLVLVTSMERKGGIEHDTLAGYPQTVRDVAAEEGVALIDLHAMSKVLYQALGADLDKAFQDGTHHNNYGSYELAKCVAEGIRQNKLPLAKFLADDFAGFDPAKPDSAAGFDVPASPLRSEKKPDGN